MFSRFLQRLNEPFPDRATVKQSFIGLLGVGAFVCLFLFILRPFGIQGTQGNLWWICAGFGGVTVLFGFVFDLFVRFVLKINTDEDSWTLGKWIFQGILLLLWIAVGNYLFLVYLSGWIWDQYSLSSMLINTFIVGFFPILFSGMWSQIKAVKNHQEVASHLKPKTHKSEESEQKVLINEFELAPKDLLFAESQQNYVAIYYLDARREPRKQLERCTLKELEQLLSDSGILRCHRSYLVNPDWIQSIRGNAQGLRLKIQGIEEEEVPVSRSYISLFK